MTAVLILSNGNSVPLTMGEIERMVAHYYVTGARTNGSQTQFALRHKTPGIPDTSIAIVANNHSEACETLKYNLHMRV